MKILVATPVVREVNSFLAACAERDIPAQTVTVGKLPVTFFPDLEMGVALGGLGKAQFALQAQHWIDHSPQARVLLCAGAAGALTGSVAVGDLVVATETIEHDIRNRFGPPRLPRFPGAEPVLAALRELPLAGYPFQVHFGPVASGDEDIVDPVRSQELYQRTQALAVAWEGAGGARACQFSELPFVEIRGITDRADRHAPADFKANVGRIMGNLVTLIIDWAQRMSL